MNKNKQNIRIGILGVNGRMGRMLVQSCINTGLNITVATGRIGSACIGKSLADFLNLESIDHHLLNVMISDDLSTVIQNCDVVIDFTTAEALATHLDICHQAKKPIMIGITGLSEQLTEKIKIAAQEIAIVHSGNYSVGVNLSVDLVRVAAQLLSQNEYAQAFEAEIIEAHHRHKIDAPSGTALMYADAIAQARQQQLADIAIYQRHGAVGERHHQSIGLQAIRGGDIVGEHSVFFFGNDEQIEIKHVANNRINFAVGAVRAATWVSNQPCGLYDMNDVIKN
ncbi:4-hydroxy-tetrahydrodipicolinate reductase [Acinetobacter wuhouensis]|uniref:4-hydroxy-tetrahydrodipicolinate reductase n=1 Tax=Acinetobacter wuhouensis TaxID=1879050 RepID=UPI000A332167|nr:4-hydroxy-tetrahydrodipicolinate reductase [Acinetobacter wuhouensis]AXQ22894.1 4-hydroxy-tetrahydrodipicolinate reductase [Acinetobacter wuhouensis]